MMSAGFFVNGPYALITTAVSADLGTHKSLAGGWGGGGGGGGRLGCTDCLYAGMHGGGTSAAASAAGPCC